MMKTKPCSPRAARALLLDLDGTLVDTAPDLGGALNRVLADHGRLPLCFAEYRPLAGEGSAALVAAGFGPIDDQTYLDELKSALLDNYYERICDESAIFPSMDALLSQLDQAGFPWGVATNKPSRFTDRLIAELGLDTRARVVISRDQVPRAKPAPDMLLKAAEQMEVDPGDCVYLGDAERDIQAARAAGMTALAAAWGYIRADDTVADWRADAVVGDGHEVLAHLDI